VARQRSLEPVLQPALDRARDAGRSREISSHSPFGPSNLSTDPRTERPSDPRPGVAHPELSPEFKRRFATGDPEALARFYELYFERVYGYVRRMLSEDHTAEDVTQDVFMHVQRSVKSYDPERELDPWVFTIATNKVRDHWRSRRHRDNLSETSLDDADTRFHPIAPRRGPLPALENAELGRLLEHAIAELPESMRSALVLRYFEGLSFERIAQMFDRNEAAVRKRYSRALDELRRNLESRLSEPEGGKL
jgi:RNA polymerase sigma-70 factor (ECF subfamily)